MKRHIFGLLLFSIFLAIALLHKAEAQGSYTYVHANSIAFSWCYPTNAVSPDLGFIIYSSSNPNINPTNWAVLTNFSSTSSTSWNGTNYPIVSGTNFQYVLPVTVPAQPQFYTIASSNVTGLGSDAITNNFPEIITLYGPIGFIPISHP
jgi:hypothetical protein